MTDQASFLERVRAPGFINEWRKAFEGVRDIFITDGASVPRQQAQEYDNGSLWITIEKPHPGIQLLAIEMPTFGLPLIIQLRVWVEKGDDALYQRLCTASPPVIHGETPVALRDQQPNSSYRAWLGKKGIEVIGLVFRISELSFLGDEEAIHPSLHIIGRQFCQWVKENVVEDDEALANVNGVMDASHEIEQDARFGHADAKTRLALVNARIGQGSYRRRILQLWQGRCAVTNSSIADVLIASHAMPWSEGSVEDCLNPYNGLLLSASVDRLFDAGLISFADDGTLLKKDVLSWEQLALLGVAPASRMRFVHAKHLPYMAAHRERFGFA